MQHGSQDLKSENLMLLHDEPFTGTAPGVRGSGILGFGASDLRGWRWLEYKVDGGLQHPYKAQIN